MKGIVKKLCFSLATVLLFLLLMEGFSNTVIIVHGLVNSPNAAVRDEIPERQYDEQLGWSNIPDLDYPDFFGPGQHLKTNSRGFRGAREFEEGVPSGSIRVMCSGDSFTFGTGVSDEATWVKLLEEKNDRLETVNLGVGGYGVDQAYLAYKQHSSDIDHHLHIFAFISADFERMRFASFVGFGKPRLRADGPKLSLTNVPVPHTRDVTRWTTAVTRKGHINKLSTIRLFSKVIQTVGFTDEQHSPLEDDQLHRITKIMCRDLKSLAIERGAKVALVHLPVRTSYFPNPEDKLRAFLRQVSNEQGVAYIDLIESYRQLDYESAGDLFLRPDQVVRYYEAGHYTIEGNQFIADALYRGLHAYADLP